MPLLPLQRRLKEKSRQRRRMKRDVINKRPLKMKRIRKERTMPKRERKKLPTEKNHLNKKEKNLERQKKRRKMNKMIRRELLPKKPLIRRKPTPRLLLRQKFREQRMLPQEPSKMPRERLNRSSVKLKPRPRELKELLLKRRSKMKPKELQKRRKHSLRKLILTK